MVAAGGLPSVPLGGAPLPSRVAGEGKTEATSVEERRLGRSSAALRPNKGSMRTATRPPPLPTAQGRRWGAVHRTTGEDIPDVSQWGAGWLAARASEEDIDSGGKGEEVTRRSCRAATLAHRTARVNTAHGRPGAFRRGGGRRDLGAWARRKGQGRKGALATATPATRRGVSPPPPKSRHGAVQDTPRKRHPRF